MIRRGKQQGWLNIPVQQLEPWAALNSVRMQHVRVGYPTIEEARGAAVLARHKIDPSDNDFTTLMTVPRDFILSRERIEEHTKVDKDFRAIIEALGEFGKTEKHFVHTPFTTYVQLLPLEHLPTFWNETEISLLEGTTLAPAVKAKLGSLYREFDTLRAKTSKIEWCQRLWWDEVDGAIAFDDWLQVDAMYRTRALEFPGLGDCMAPCIDMANHAGGEQTSAIYEVDAEGNAVLLLRPGRIVEADEEITISYGDSKGACEMLFSYGFLENGVDTARELFLDLHMLDDDPLAKAKLAVADAPPGVKLVDCAAAVEGDPTSKKCRWEGDFVWLIVVNEEDGLEFQIERTTTGDEDLVATWKGETLASASDLAAKLTVDTRWDLFRLRAVSVLQGRVAAQLTELYGYEERVGAIAATGAATGTTGDEPVVEERTAALALELRRLEGDLLELAYAEFEEQKAELVRSEVILAYLAAANSGSSEAPVPPAGDGVETEDEDFS